jgi:hypothetical protein
MKLPNLSTFVTSALAMSALPSTGSASSPNPLGAEDSSSTAITRNSFRGLRKLSGNGGLPGSDNNGCRARIKERQNADAVYTVSSASHDFCPNWVGDVIAGCPGTDTLSLSENFASSFTIPNDVIASSTNPVMYGYVSTDGVVNSTISDCVAEKFHQILDENKNDIVYKIKLGLLIGIPAAAVTAFAVAAAVLCVKNRMDSVAAPPSA